MTKQKSKFDFSTFLKDLKQTDVVRPNETNAERQYFLIVCEGTKTEPSYFNALKALLPPQLAQVDIVGDGTDTIGVVQKAIALRNKRSKSKLQPSFDEVWAVFDKDDFPNARFNEAIALGQSEQIHIAYSNEAFELWYILHFQFLDAAVSRKVYIEILSNILGEYEKNMSNIYHLLHEKGNEKQAVQRAKTLLSMLCQNNPALEKPTTRVHELVEHLNQFKG